MATSSNLRQWAARRPWDRRVIGLVYVSYIIMAFAGQGLAGGVLVKGDPIATAANLGARGDTYLLGLAMGLVATGVYLVLVMLLYRLFRATDPAVALIGAAFGTAGCICQSMAYSFAFAATDVLTASPTGATFGQAQTAALGAVLFALDAAALRLALPFFGAFGVAIGYLIVRSTIVPRIIGLLMAVAGLLWLTFAYPPAGTTLTVAAIGVGGLAEGLLALWLLIVGVRRREAAVAAATA